MSNLIRVEQSEIDLLNRINLWFKGGHFVLNKQEQKQFSDLVDKIKHKHEIASCDTTVQENRDPMSCHHYNKTQLYDPREILVGSVCDKCLTRWDAHGKVSFVPPKNAVDGSGAQEIIDQIRDRHYAKKAEEKKFSACVEVETHISHTIKLTEREREFISSYVTERTEEVELIERVERLITEAFNEGKCYGKQ